MNADADSRHARANGRLRALTSAVVEPILQTRSRADDRCEHLARAHHAYTRIATARTGVRKSVTSPAGLTLAELVNALDHSPTVDDLRELRRVFAATRHPDRVAIGDRRLATIDMQTANDLIDRAIEQRSHAAKA